MFSIQKSINITSSFAKLIIISNELHIESCYKHHDHDQKLNFSIKVWLPSNIPYWKKLTKILLDDENFVQQKVLSYDYLVQHFNKKVRKKFEKNLMKTQLSDENCVRQNFCPMNVIPIRNYFLLFIWNKHHFTSVFADFYHSRHWSNLNLMWYVISTRQHWLFSWNWPF